MEIYWILSIEKPSELSSKRRAHLVRGVKKFAVLRLAKQKLFKNRKNQDSWFPFFFLNNLMFYTCWEIAGSEEQASDPFAYSGWQPSV